MTQYKEVNIIPKLDEKVFQTSSSDIHNNEWRHGQCYVTSLVKLFELNEPEGQFDPCSNNTRNIINLSSYMLSEKEIKLISKGLSFFPDTLILIKQQSQMQYLTWVKN